MSLPVAFSTERKNIKLIFNTITRHMMIMDCCIITMPATTSIDVWQTTICNSVRDSIQGHRKARVLVFNFNNRKGDRFFTFSGLSPLVHIFLRLFCFVVLAGYATFLAICLMAVLAFSGFIKIGKRFSCFTSTAFFCCNLLRHGFFLHKKLCSEPLQAQYLCGSFYYTIFPQECNQKLNNHVVTQCSS